MRSNNSFLRGASTIGELVARAKQLGRTSLALTDDGLYGAVEFWHACRAADLQPILGGKIGPVTLLTKNRTGYSNLCRMLTRREYVPEWREGLVAITEDPSLPADFVEIVRPGRSQTHERRLRECGLPPVASNDVHFATPDGFATHRLLTAIRENTTIQSELPVVNPGNYMRNDLFEDFPEAVANRDRIAKQCAWDFLPAPRVMPDYEGREDLRALCEKGLAWRYDTVSEEVRERLDRELRIIGDLGYTDYFLVVHDIVRLSRARGVPVAGRGSGASSLTAYVLGITNVCPVDFDIPFERFLHEQRTDPPDLDIDFCWRIRDEIIGEVFQRYGEKRVAMVCTHIHLQPRSAFRETAKAYGMSDEGISAFQRTGKFPGNAAMLMKIRDAAERIRGYPRHLSVHPGGVVIVPDSVDRYAPTEPAEKGVIVTQYDKDGVEEAGLIKIDLLGNRALSTIHETLRIIDHKVDVERLPDGDPATVRVLSEGRTLGCNQLESPAMRSLLRMLRTHDKRGVMKALALIRPGAANLGGKENFVRRERGLDPPTPMLPDTHGVLIYEDDVMLIASELAGFSLAEADGFRRKIAKRRNEDELTDLCRSFLARAKDKELARRLWVQMAKFNEYSFCRAHAASYGVLAWSSAYLKAHHPVAHWVAALNNNQGLYEKRTYVEEAKRQGIRVHLPCVNRSEVDFTAENGGIRVGLGQLHGIAQKEIASLLENRPFVSFEDFLARTEIRKPMLKALILCGALDFTKRRRPELVMELLAPGRPHPPLPDFEEGRKFEYEFDLLNLSVRKHILSYLAPGPRRAITSTEISKNIGCRVRLVGVMATLRITATRRDEAMEFLTLEDESGIYEVTIFPNLLRRISRHIGTLGPYVIEGKVESAYDAITITANRVQVPDEANPTPWTAAPAPAGTTSYPGLRQSRSACPSSRSPGGTG